MARRQAAADLTAMLETKCTAETPRCADCVTNDWSCVYEDNKKDRLSEVTSQRQLLVDLVHKLRLSANTSDRQRIEDALAEVSNQTLSFINIPLVQIRFRFTRHSF